MNFSKQLKKYRELKNFSQEELAEKIYVTRQTISKWENEKSYPDIHNLIALSLFLVYVNFYSYRCNFNRSSDKILWC